MCKNLHVNIDIAIIMFSVALYTPVSVIKEITSVFSLYIHVSLSAWATPIIKHDLSWKHGITHHFYKLILIDLFFGSSWCAFSYKFSPTLITYKVCKEHQP